MLARVLAEEAAVAFRYNGIDHAVMMATPADLHDFAVGFTLTERIAIDPSEVRLVRACAEAGGHLLDITLSAAALRRLLAGERRRGRQAHTSCGLCGVADLDSVRVPGMVVPGARPPCRAVARAVAELRDHQPLGQLTHATHAAAWADPDGRIVLAREDVGRHSALDKLIGARARAGACDDGFCLISSRCSLEMVQKAAAAGIGCLVALAAPTALAVQAAQQAGLTLVADARDAPAIAGYGGSGSVSSLRIAT